MKFFKKNQIIIYTIALMLVVAGYLNYTSSDNLNSAVQTSSREEELTQMANIGDAQLVSSNDVVSDNNVSNNSISTNKNMTSENVINNTVNTSNTVNASATSSKSDNEYFTTSKLERDTMYSQMLETYENILNSNNSLETQKQSATEEITKINNIKNSIMICENLLKTKSFDNSVIFVNGDSISVVVGKNELTKEEVAQIQNILSREMSAKAENIHISNK